MLTSPQTLQLEYTLKLLNMDDLYQTDVIRSKLTRKLEGILEDVHEELVTALDDVIHTRDDGTWSTCRRRDQSFRDVIEWIKVPIVETMQRVICGVSSRVFVGLPLCV
jgi:hypothetical protein